MVQSRGPLLTIEEAVKWSGLSAETIRKYHRSGVLKLEFGGGMVYYRDLLRAAWIVKQQHLRTKNVGRSK